MNVSFHDYSLFFKFMEEYESVAYNEINRKDSLIVQLEEMTELNDQYFFIADLLMGKIIFASERSKMMIGVDPDILNPYHNVEVIHPDELYRNTSGWAKLLSIANELLLKKKGYSIMSKNMKMRAPSGVYHEILFQCYSFYSQLPHPTVYVFIALTNIDQISLKKNGYHYYIGEDMSYFKYPNEMMLEVGISYTKRELDIIKLIAAGHSSEEIAEELFISLHTVNSHRGNILKKSNKTHVSDLIIDLKEMGLI